MKSSFLSITLLLLFFNMPVYAIYISYISADPSCNNNNGFIHATAHNGTLPYTYQWSTGQTTPNRNNLAPGTYTLTVHDALNATATLTLTLVNSPTFFADALTFVKPFQLGVGLALPCNSQCNGIAFLSVEYVGGTPPYTISTTPYHPFGYYGPTQVPGIQNICATDSYTAIVTDALGCTGTAMSEGPFPPTSFSYISQIFGVCNGSVGHATFEFTDLPGIPFHIAWTGPESGALYWNFSPVISLDSLTPGNYSMTVTNPDTYTTCDTIINFTIPGNVSGAPPATPGTITATGGNTKVCPGDIKTYSIAPVSGATSYTWTPPLGGFITSGQGTASVTIQFSYSFPASDTLRVVAHNSCGTSAQRKLKISRNTPLMPGAITATGGNTKVCPGTTKTYSIAPVAGATSYTWTRPTGSVITAGQGSTSVTLLFNSGFVASDTLHVKSSNACGQSANRNLIISRNNPVTPAAITGNNFGVCNLNGIPFSVTNVAGMTYNWSFNTGTATVASGQGTSSITTNYGAGFVSGSLSVTASNGCGTSAARVKTIYAKPATPVSITGATSICLNQQNVPYSIAPLANVTNYTWTGPTGSHISVGSTTSAGTTLITTSTAVSVDFATTAGAIKVRGNNACASGSYKTLSVAIVCREGDFSQTNFETRIYPNPASTEFTLETDDASLPFDLEVYDAYGRLVFSEASLNSGFKVNTNGWADGLYSVVVQNGGNTTNLKLAIKK